MEETTERVPLPLFAYSVMPNHWHFVVRGETDDQITAFFRWLTHTHTMRWHAHHRTSGTGHLYQGRFKAFPIEESDHLLSVLRYVERDPLQANLCEKADARALLAKWPIPRPRQWRSYVNKPINEKELEAIRKCTRRGTPFSNDRWISQSAARLHLQYTLSPRGRPKMKK
ncbi:MAG: transposase [Pirellulales bacterium]